MPGQEAWISPKERANFFTGFGEGQSESTIRQGQTTHRGGNINCYHIQGRVFDFPVLKKYKQNHKKKCLTLNEILGMDGGVKDIHGCAFLSLNKRS